jgi:spermidine/putrescine transport system ATP-binding protein
LTAKVLSVVFKGVHFEMVVDLGGKTVTVHDYEESKVGDTIGLHIDPYEIHLMKLSHEQAQTL